MNKAFTRLIKIRGLLREVNFRRLPHSEASYHVDLTDERSTRYQFIMQREGGGWKLPAGTLPDWITEAEALLSEAIHEEEGPGRDSQKSA